MSYKPERERGKNRQTNRGRHRGRERNFLKDVDRLSREEGRRT